MTEMSEKSCENCYVSDMTDEEMCREQNNPFYYNPCSGCGSTHGSYPHWKPRPEVEKP